MNNLTLEPGHVTDIPISKLRADPDQPRKTFDQAGLESLAASLKAGVQVPLLVRPAVNKGNYIIHDGERRYRAASIAKLKTLPVLLLDTVVDAGDKPDILAAQLTVNNLREKLKPMDVARVLADLRRNHFASLNDLAAWLERTGLPAIKKQQIGDLIALVDLPTWAQQMIDDGHVEASAIRRLKVALPYDSILEEVRDDLKQTIGWRGGITAREAMQALGSGFRGNSADLGRIQNWHNDPVHFNAKVACKGCEHLVKFDGEMFCMDQAAYEKKNAEAKAAGLLPGGIKPDKPAPAGQPAEQAQEEKAKARARTIGQKARDYLHAYLVDRIVSNMLGDIESSTQVDITRELLAWHAMDRPGERWRSPSAGDQYDADEKANINSLEDLFAPIELESPMLHAACEVASCLNWRETQVVCHQLWSSSIEHVWKMDEEFLRLFRKAELLHLVEMHGMEDEFGGGWDKLKVTEIRAGIIDRSDRVTKPQILQDIYADVEAPHKPYQYDQEDDEAGK